MAVSKNIKTDHMAIQFKYKTLGSDEWQVNDITLEEYFDFSMLDEGEELEVDSIPEYCSFIEYFNDERRQISQIFISIKNNKNNTERRFSQAFWDNQNCSILERIDTADGIKSYHGYIITTLLPTEVTGNSEKDNQIIRFSPGEEEIKCGYHGIIHDNADGSQREIVITPKKGV